MAVLTTQRTTSAGAVLTYASAAAGGDKFNNTGKEVVMIKNGSASSITVTFDSVRPCDYGYDHDLVIIVAAGDTQIVGPFSTARFNDTNKQTSISYSASASVTVAVVNSQ